MVRKLGSGGVVGNALSIGIFGRVDALAVFFCQFLGANIPILRRFRYRMCDTWLVVAPPFLWPVRAVAAVT